MQAKGRERSVHGSGQAAFFALCPALLRRGASTRGVLQLVSCSHLKTKKSLQCIMTENSPSGVGTGEEERAGIGVNPVLCASVCEKFEY